MHQHFAYDANRNANKHDDESQEQQAARWLLFLFKDICMLPFELDYPGMLNKRRCVRL
jgi:hypothetical protein